MRVLCDENVPLAVERAIASAGHDVVSVRARLPGAADLAVLELAVREQRLLVTYDRDFGALLFKGRVRPAPSVLYVRTSLSPAADGPRVLKAMERTEAGHIVVIDGLSLRKRQLEGDVLGR